MKMTAVKVSPVKNEAGFSLIDMLFVVALIGLLATLAIPGLMRARGAAQSASALGTLRVVSSAQLSFAITCGLGFYSPDFPTLAIKPPSAVDAFLPQELATGPTFIKAGYNFSMAGTSLAGAPATCNGLGAGQSAPGYAVVADELDVAGQGRFFGSNADGLIYEDTASLGGTMPETGAPPSGHPIK
jgi:type IV pilus assembly protein PilA